MSKITTETPRVIVEDFARLIREKARPGPKPSKEVIHFRNEGGDFERDVVYVPVALLRYRKENGRIASDVQHYEKTNGPLDEKDTSAQEILRGFLAAKDPEKTEDLSKSIAHIGQTLAAIITCDGFLINGNRRKMVYERLRDLEPGTSKYDYMKVVILPGADAPGGAPTLRDIEQLENRYQLQSDGKSEYYGFDRALSIKRKIDVGYSLEEQLRDDPRYANATTKELAQAVKETEREYLQPLECVERYLAFFNRQGLYGTVSEGRSDKEGRWQAFLDYSNSYHRYFKNAKWREQEGVPEEDIGAIEEAAFKIIRVRHLKELKKVHAIMRDLPKLCAKKDSRKEILKICDEVPDALPKDERHDEKGSELSVEQADRKWIGNYQRELTYRVKKATEIVESADTQETPVALLDAALRKLNHDKMQVRQIGAFDLDRARHLVAEVKKRAQEIESEIYHYKKELDSLRTKK